MFIILAYDISSKKRSKIEKICKQYLYRVQESVFEGELTKSSLLKLKSSLMRYVDVEIDSIVIYKSIFNEELSKESIGKQIPDNKYCIF